MSDFSIPGTGTSKYGTDKLIEGLMKLERAPRDKAAERLKALEEQKSTWLDFNRRLSGLRDGARGLFSFRNPFAERVATSSDSDSVTASATREAMEQTRTVEVLRAAAADRFVSSELAKDYKVPAGTYGFSVGDKAFELRFGGGSLQEFADAVSRKGAGLARAGVVSIKPDTRSLVVEALKTGSKNRLGFSGDATALALEAGLIEKVSSTRRDLDPAKPLPWDKPLDGALVRVEPGAASGGSGAEGKAGPDVKAAGPALAIVAGGEAKLALLPSVKAQGMTLEIEYRLIRLPAAGVATPPPGPTLEAVGSATYEGITIKGAPSASALPEWAPPPRPPVVEDRVMASAIAPDGRTAPLPELKDGDQPQKLSVKLDEYLSEAAAVGFRVRDTTRRLEVLAVRVYDPSETGGFRPRNPVAVSADASVKVDGIEAQRPTNDIADLVPGVTLNLRAPSTKPVKLRIEPNRAAAKEALIALVGTYNRLMASINIYSQTDERLLNEISYFTDEEKKTMRARLGSLQGDPTLSLLRASLQRIMMNPYETSAGTDLTLLAQIGIATDARRPGAGQGYDVSRLRGYLEIDEEALKKGLDERFDAVRQLFGNDTNGDLIVDAGAAFALDAALKPYVDAGGIVSIKTGTVDAAVGAQKRMIESLDRQLAMKQDELKRKYGMMEGALNRMQGTSSAIDSFSKSGTQ